MKKRTVAAITAITITAGLYTYNSVTPLHSTKLHAYKFTENVPLVQPEYVDYEAVMSALSTKSQIVGLTGNASKTVKHSNEKWYGDRAYTMTITGEFKLGVDTEDIQITTHGNTIKVTFPQPKLISADFPYDQAIIGKDVGLLRKDLTETEIQSLYGKARKGAIEEIHNNETIQKKSVEGVEKAIDGLLLSIPHVEDIEYQLEESEDAGTH